MKTVLVAPLALLLAACQSLAPSPGAPFTAVAGYGAVAEVPGAALRPDSRTALRAVFPATHAAPTPAQVVPALDRAARYLNLLAAQGLRIRPGDVVVVISGPATPAVLGDADYRKRPGQGGVAANPNLPLIQALRDAGAVVSVCGQALHGQKIALDAVSPGIRVDLSAMTTLARLQAQGYVLIPE